ncbi:tyrosine-type recombinase/integrase [Nocardioides sp. NPDC092400]|uniref:tyrosine-type recombinase/integrase n=1 Tax=Nocardioides sp. NPDC092400 TaxID=3155196 RepID=UPI003419ABFB
MSSIMSPTTPLEVVREAYLLPYAGDTRNAYVYQLGRWLDWCTTHDIAPLAAGRVDVEQFVHHLHVELGHLPSSVHAALTPVRGFYRFAYAEGVIDRDPAVLARRPRNPKPYRDTVGLDREQMRSFLQAGDRLGGRYAAAAYLLACLALRASEVCAVRIEDFQCSLRGHRVLELAGKGGLHARMPLPVPVVRALEVGAEGRTAGLLIRRRDGAPLSRQGLRTLVRTLGRRAGIALPLTPHLLRHSCITNALESGASLRKVQDLARHAEPRTTMRYDRNRLSLDDHAVHAVVAFISPSRDDSDEPSREAGHHFRDDDEHVTAATATAAARPSWPAGTGHGWR